jgi:hypothetical protein
MDDNNNFVPEGDTQSTAISQQGTYHDVCNKIDDINSLTYKLMCEIADPDRDYNKTKEHIYVGYIVDIQRTLGGISIEITRLKNANQLPAGMAEVLYQKWDKAYGRLMRVEASLRYISAKKDE